ncbi:hypothetical protein N0V82_007078 [Gnomoniopsis sp. IMI 355080]|nr:hypothetical protein N0V82_007078 [Gnomoniopsis sp. IMI 355080]
MPSQLRTRKLGKNGPEVTALGFGCMNLAGIYGKPTTDEERFALLDHVYNSGCLNWDTADSIDPHPSSSLSKLSRYSRTYHVYEGYRDNEDLLGAWFKLNPGKRDHVFLATKFAFYTEPGNKSSFRIRNEPEYIQEAIDKSLKRLGLPFVDLYYCHRLDENQPVETTVTEMKKLQDAGKIKYIGLSECSADSLRRACKVVHVDAVQVEYSPFAMEIESKHIDLLRVCRELGVATVAYGPLGRGFLTGSIRSRDDFDETDFRQYMPRFAPEVFHKNLELVDTIQALANKKGCTAGQLTLAWLMSQGDDIIPIPGTTRIKNFDENLGALKIQVSKDEDKKIREAIENTEIVGARNPEAIEKISYVITKPL